MLTNNKNIANDVFRNSCGNLNAKLPPSTDPNMPEIPTILPLFANSRSFFSFVYAAVRAVGTVAINEKPCAGKFPKPPKKINRGILTIPPPIPSRPDSIPENTPINKYKKIFPSYCEE